MRWFRRRKSKGHEIDPDEVLLDASNIPGFDQHQYEGRLVQPISRRNILLFGIGTVVVFCLLLGEAFRLQVTNGAELAQRSEANHLRDTAVFSERGVIYDRNGEVLVRNTAVPEDEFAHRVYTQPGFGHVLGYVTYPKKDRAGFYFDEEIKGVTGVEAVFNDALAGENGLLLEEVNALGAVLSSGTVVTPEDGRNVSLSLDARVQRSLYTHISELAEEIPFDGGAGVVMDVETGEIIALVSYPEVDPNAFAEGNPEIIGGYQEDRRNPFLNRVVAGQYTPGSVVKPFVTAAALEEGVVTSEDTFVSTGQIEIPNPYTPSQPTIFRDWKAHGVVDAVRALAVSSNVYFYIVGGGYQETTGLGILKLSDWLRDFGFGEESGIALGSEADGLVPTPSWKEDRFGDSWRIGDTYYTAIGQYAFQATPLQVVRAVAGVANGSYLPTPTLQKGERGARTPIRMSAETREVVVEGMRAAVTEGTAQGLNVPAVSVAAKTGTAELGARKEFVNAWVTGFFPAEAPKYAFAVVMERGPRENVIGGVAVMRGVLDELAQEAPEYFSTP